jgi:hypothetical protein
LASLWLADRGAAPLTPNGIKIRLKRLGQAAGIPDVHAHRWRHSFAHEWKRAGGDTGDLMLLLGWTFDDMPRHYGASAAAERRRRRMRGWASGNACSAMRAAALARHPPPLPEAKSRWPRQRPSPWLGPPRRFGYR